MKDIIPQPVVVDVDNLSTDIPPEREHLEFSTYLEMFKSEFAGIAEHLLDSDDKIIRSAAVAAPEGVSDEELLKDIVHEILEIPPKDQQC
jgi:hypothetical protein|tara:strand:+ start:315 stop:584 length:270 start_codon:yes stop_codon:yes gene_type:complete